MLDNNFFAMVNSLILKSLPKHSCYKNWASVTWSKFSYIEEWFEEYFLGQIT